MLIHDYADDGNIAGVADELAKNIPIEVPDSRRQRTPLMHAVISRKAGPEMVQFLLERGTDPNAEEQGPYGIRENVLALAVKAGNLDKVRLLLDAGADIHYQRPSRYDVLTDAVHVSCSPGDDPLLSLLRLLIERGAALDNESDYGESALSVTSNRGRFDAVRLLLDAGACPSPLRWTPLMRAIALGTLDEVQTLLAEGADLTARDRWDRTPWLLSQPEHRGRKYGDQLGLQYRNRSDARGRRMRSQ